MSKRLRDCDSYIRLLLSGNQLQSEAILVTATDKQVECISEIIRNILQLPVGKKTKDLITKYNKLLITLSDKNNTVQHRLDIVQKSHSKILEVLLSVKNKLLQIL